jgi:DNA-binding transcriptional LysR family regulator
MSDLDRLIRFAVVAEELSFSQAARRLNVDQPWLSRQIQQLETHLGFALFVRSTRKVALTSDGEELFAYAGGLSKVAGECRQAVGNMKKFHSLMLDIGVHPFSYWVPERKLILDGFRNRHKNVNINIISNYTPRLLSKLRKRMVDSVIIAQPFDFPDLEALTIHSSPISLLVPAEDPLAECASVPIAGLAGRRIPLTNPQLNPALSELLYGPIFEAGAIPVIVPEGEPAIPFYAATERLPVLSVGWPHNQHGELADFVPVKLEPPVPVVRYALVRRREPARGLLEHFWNNAVQIVGQLAGEGATENVVRRVAARQVASLPGMETAARQRTASRR